jgi:hypothetical protein
MQAGRAERETGSNKCPLWTGPQPFIPSGLSGGFGSTSARRGPINDGPLRQFSVGPGSAKNGNATLRRPMAAIDVSHWYCPARARVSGRITPLSGARKKPVYRLQHDICGHGFLPKRIPHGFAQGWFFSSPGKDNGDFCQFWITLELAAKFDAIRSRHIPIRNDEGRV